jgi:hypothetical protein
MTVVVKHAAHVPLESTCTHRKSWLSKHAFLELLTANFCSRVSLFSRAVVPRLTWTVYVYPWEGGASWGERRATRTRDGSQKLTKRFSLGIPHERFFSSLLFATVAAAHIQLGMSMGGAFWGGALTLTRPYTSSSLQGEYRAGGHVSTRPAGLPHPVGHRQLPQGNSTY